MTVNELIKKLSNIKNKNKHVSIFHQNRNENWVYLALNDLIEIEDEILVGNNLPAECFEKDYKYERG